MVIHCGQYGLFMWSMWLWPIWLWPMWSVADMDMVQTPNSLGSLKMWNAHVTGKIMSTRCEEPEIRP